ncbi:MAG: hypothetical protein IKZ04_06555 [Spirochaetaceae bacterium]|nr:hypothetical protein [Spirochaetaceae bacterium]
MSNTTEVLKPEKKSVYKRRFGDRKDGRRVRTLDPITNVAPFIMPTRVGAMNYFQAAVQMTEIEKFIHKKRAEGKAGFGVMHVLVASYIRMLSQTPGLNRFLSGYRIYARHNIEIIMAVKKELKIDAPETMIKFVFKPDATVDDVYNQFTEKIEAFKNEEKDANASFEKVVSLLGCIPRFLLKFTVDFLKFLDYNGWLPKFLTDLSPFHGTLVITSMASLGIPSIYHHLYNFGNVPVFISFSAIRKENEVDKEGNVSKVRYLDLNFSTDERICDGHYYAVAFREIKRNLLHPEFLETPPETVVEDIE